MGTANWEIIIGLETHAQLNTASKIFSGASTAFGAAPNTQACAVDIALPGVLPVLNRGAVERAIRFGLAVGGTIAPHSVFARKNYFYPDLPKGYQISQYELPVVSGGSLAIRVSSGGTATEKTVRLTRAHLEEDAGKSLHDLAGSHIALGHGKSGIDLNRAGTPLLEIVSEPDMRSASEAVAYARALHALVRWIGICDGNMQEGSFRCDANVSVRPVGSDVLGTRREIKNLNSFRFLQQAIEYEARWQIETLEDGGRIVQSTVLFDPATGQTRAMRSKEEAHDYRYFPDPDLLPLEISATWIDEMKSGMPELPEAMKTRFIKNYGLSDYDAALLTSSFGLAAYFEKTIECLEKLGIASQTSSKLIGSWLNGEFSTTLNADQVSIEEYGLRPEWLALLLMRVLDGTISRNAARAIFPGMVAVARKLRNDESAEEFSVDKVIEESGLKQISDSGALEKLIDDVLAANPKSVEEFRAGKEKAFNALVGQAMKATKGKANPQQVNELLRKKLGT
jgi:aspartyl-tRNA(Asn)/glutamyl-tRNA(Gln) amidotransferase subunit B